VVLAAEEADVERLKEYLDAFVDCDHMPREFAAEPELQRNPIQGAYVSTPYSTRDNALYGPWQGQ
jgi:hypothetical protein